jgi:hypothetical protein
VFGHEPPHALLPHSLPPHCGVHWHVPFEHRPDLPIESVHDVVLLAFSVVQLSFRHTPTLQPAVRRLHSESNVHSTHSPSPMHFSPAWQLLEL